MSEYRVEKHGVWWKLLTSDNRQLISSNIEGVEAEYQYLAGTLNAETAQLLERIAELEAWLTIAWQYTPTNKLPQELFESLQGKVMDGDSTQELIKAFLAKKAGGNE